MKTGPVTPSALQGNVNHNESFYFLSYYADISSAPAASQNQQGGTRWWMGAFTLGGECVWYWLALKLLAWNVGPIFMWTASALISLAWLLLFTSRSSLGQAAFDMNQWGGTAKEINHSLPPHQETLCFYLLPPQQRPEPRSDVIKNALTRIKR